MRTLDEVKEMNVSDVFMQKMCNAMCMSAFKYGDVSSKQGAKALERIQQEIEVFKEDGNLEHMVNVANWAMMRFMFPCGEEEYRGTDSKESTRRVYKSVFEHLRDYIMEND